MLCTQRSTSSMSCSAPEGRGLWGAATSHSQSCLVRRQFPACTLPAALGTPGTPHPHRQGTGATAFTPSSDTQTLKMLQKGASVVWARIGLFWGKMRRFWCHAE